MQLNETQMREAFEQEMRSYLAKLRGPHCMALSTELSGEYAYLETEIAWRSWRAALRAQADARPMAVQQMPTPDELRAIAREARNTASPSDEPARETYVLAGWRAAMATHPEASAPGLSDMTAMVDAAMVEMQDIHPPMRRSECERLIRAALSGASAATLAEPSDWTADECVATGQTCTYGPHGRHGETQCKYCGAKPAAQPQAEPSDRDENLCQSCLDSRGELFCTAGPQCVATSNRSPQSAQCTACEPEGVYSTDGEGPFDCYECGKKAAYLQFRPSRDAQQLADWLLVEPTSGECLNFAGPLERDFLGLSRVKMVSENGNIWTLTAGLKEGYKTETQRLHNIREAAQQQAEPGADERAGFEAWQAVELPSHQRSSYTAADVEFNCYEAALAAWLERAKRTNSREKSAPLHLGACITDGKLYITAMQSGPNHTTTVVATAGLDMGALLKDDCHAVMTATQSGQRAGVAGGWDVARKMAALNRKLREPEWHIESIREFQRELQVLEDRALAAPTHHTDQS